MSMADAKQEYQSALRQAKKQYRARINQGKNPYLTVLDDILENTPIATQESLGLVSIPMESIAGTKTGGRHTAFSSGFLPLLELNTEFATKWCTLYEAHLNEGIQQPIRAYEFLNRFYVQEGNKRVSVLSYCQAASVKAEVIRLIPPLTDSTEIRIYYEFMAFYRLSKINYLYFTREGSFMRLQTAVCKGAQEAWTGDDRANFFYFYTLFRREFLALGGADLQLTTGDAILVYLSFHRYSDALQQTQAQIRDDLQKLWSEIEILAHHKTVEVSLEPNLSPKPAPQPLFPSFFPRRQPRQTPLNVVFIQDRNPEVSAWAAGHRLARESLEQAFEDQINITFIENAECGLYDEAEIEAAARGGADVIFATSSEMMPACLKVAARHPQVKILNCSLLQPHPLVRTYSCRIYEAKYLMGILAGMLTQTPQVGYIANYPLYGVCSAVNAFARGLQAVRPDARVILRWQCQPNGKPMDFSDRPDITVFSGRDQKAPHPRSQATYYGLCRRLADGSLEEIAYPIWHWGNIYQHIIRSILNGAWENDSGDGFRGISYWWGMSAEAVELHHTDALPDAPRHLLELITRHIRSCEYDPFGGRIVTNTGRVIKTDGNSFTPEEIIHMNWLNENVDGEIPVLDDPPAELRALLKQQGMYPDSADTL